MEKILFVLIIAIVVFEFLLERVLDYLNATCWSEKLPEELQGIYEQEKYSRSQQYLKANHWFSQLTESFNFILVMLMLLLGGFAFLDNQVRAITDNPVLMALLFFGAIGVVADFLGTPFSIYSTFVIEQRFGFNKTTVRTFILDKIKGWVLAAVVGGGLLALIVWIYGVTGSWFWIIAWGVISLFTILMTLFYSNIIVPLFNKQTPLEPGELRDAIEEFAGKTGFSLKNIYVIDGSKRSTKANAYFTGLGRKKRIVLYDTLIKDHPVDELVAVLAHEIGHYRKKHTLIGTLISVLQTGLILFILSRFLDNPHLSGALGASQPSFHLGLVAFGILFTPISLITGLGLNILSRMHEFQADRFAAVNHNAESLRNALVRLSVNNLSNLRPHDLYVFFHYSHPPLLKRLKRLSE
ncbi:MAG TPA: M48 family metallopeptidase [Bacteroidales bacterium]|nr:M48 family metallopeptidase [Bacteroidales bacterium]HPI86682.1 M48 family metallopeptidase [Bacteroidales bacterium]HPM93118.1 M48 family metallopeptidase [Bacteroidales bacterium]